jgi:hypothetical protein
MALEHARLLPTVEDIFAWRDVDVMRKIAAQVVRISSGAQESLASSREVNGMSFAISNGGNGIIEMEVGTLKEASGSEGWLVLRFLEVSPCEESSTIYGHI